MTIQKFRKKPVVIDALQWDGKNLREIITFTDGPPDTRTNHAAMKWEQYEDLVARDGLKIFTLEGAMQASIGDWIIKGVNGEFYPCKPDIFEKTYDPVSNDNCQKPVTVHPDDFAVDRFAAAMKAKLAKKRAEGFGGWEDPEQCHIDYLMHLLREQIHARAVIDPIDIGNFAMMLHNRREKPSHGR